MSSPPLYSTIPCGELTNENYTHSRAFDCVEKQTVKHKCTKYDRISGVL